MRVQLLYFADCPNHEAARASLVRCLETLGLAKHFENVDISADELPGELRGWGSPTILVNGVDVAGRVEPDSGGAAFCRVYAPPGVPTDEQIKRCLSAARGAGR